MHSQLRLHRDPSMATIGCARAERYQGVRWRHGRACTHPAGRDGGRACVLRPCDPGFRGGRRDHVRRKRSSDPGRVVHRRQRSLRFFLAAQLPRQLRPPLDRRGWRHRRAPFHRARPRLPVRRSLPRLIAGSGAARQKSLHRCRAKHRRQVAGTTGALPVVTSARKHRRKSLTECLPFLDVNGALT